jgi:hypothetical protein
MRTVSRSARVTSRITLSPWGPTPDPGGRRVRALLELLREVTGEHGGYKLLWAPPRLCVTTTLPEDTEAALLSEIQHRVQATHRGEEQPMMTITRYHQ